MRLKTGILLFFISFLLQARDATVVEIEKNLQAGKVEEAKLAVGKYLTSHDEGSAYNEVGNMYARLKRWPEAVHYYEILTQREPQNPRAWYQLGLAYHQNGKVDDAVKSLRQSLNIDSKSARTYSALGEMLELAHDRLDARNIYMTAIKKLGNQYEFVSRACKLNQRDFLLAQAIKDCKLAITLRPDDVVSMTLLARVYYDKSERDRAMALLKEVIGKFPKHPLAYRARGLIFYNEKAYEAAASDLGKAFGLDPYDDEAGIHLGRALFELSLYDIALQAFVESTRLNRTYRFEISTRQRDLLRKNKDAVAAQYQAAIEEL